MDRAEVERLLNVSRRAVIGLGSAALATACGGGPDQPRSPHPAGAALSGPPDRSAAMPRTSLLDARFDITDRFHPVAVVSPEFTLVNVEEQHAVGTETVHDGVIVAPFTGVEVDVTASRSPGVVIAGMRSVTGDLGIHATWSPSTGTAGLELTQTGRTRVLASARVDTSTVSTVGFALCENRATVLVREGDSPWRAVLSERDAIARALDLRRPSTLSSMRFVSGVRGGTMHLRAVRAGLFGMAGLRDPHVVQDADGTPYIRDGHAYLTWTCAGLGFFQQAHWGVFRMSLKDPSNLVQVAQIYTRRGGLLLGDHAGQLVRDGETWVVANSSWGDFTGNGVHVRWARTTSDLLTGVHVIDTIEADLPTSMSTWDPGFTRIGGHWVVAFVESPSQDPFDFHPALAQTAHDSPFEGLERVGADTRRHQTEGPILARDRVGWRMLASDGDAREYRAYDLSMKPLGVLRAPYGTNIPHAQVIPMADGGWLMTTFDSSSQFSDLVGYGAHGAVVILRAR